MDQGPASDQHTDGSPVFSAYRRGYDPEEVDRYLDEQRRKLEEANIRAAEAERKLDAAVGQLRELHRRVAVLESEPRPLESPSIDTLGERVQRILQEAWEASTALRQAAEREVAEMRERMGAEAEEIIDGARQKAEAIEQQIDRRRRAFVERLEQERERARSELSFLREQRKAAVDELMQAKTLIEATVRQVTSAPSDAPRGGRGSVSVMPIARVSPGEAADLPEEALRTPAVAEGGPRRAPMADEQAAPRPAPAHELAARTASAAPEAPARTAPPPGPRPGETSRAGDQRPVVHAPTAARPGGAPRPAAAPSGAPQESGRPRGATPWRGERGEDDLHPTVPVLRLPPTPREADVDVSELVRNHRAVTGRPDDGPDFTILEPERKPRPDGAPSATVFDFEAD